MKWNCVPTFLILSVKNISLTENAKGGNWRWDRRPPDPCSWLGRSQWETKSNSCLATSLQCQISISGGLTLPCLNCIKIPPCRIVEQFGTSCLGQPCWSTADQLIPLWPILFLLSQVSLWNDDLIMIWKWSWKICCFSIVPALSDRTVIQLVGTKSSVKHYLQGLSLLFRFCLKNNFCQISQHRRNLQRGEGSKGRQR